jgi:hypothetical protein
MDGWMGGWMDGWMEFLRFVSVSAQLLSESRSRFTVYVESVGLNSMTTCYMFRLIKPSSGSTH